MTPNSNLFTFILQVPVYHKTEKDLLNAVAAGLAGWVAGPFIFCPLAAAVGRSSVIFWSLLASFACQIWAAEMTGPDDFIPYLMSRFVCGLFGTIPAILGAGYIIDMFFLHQRGKAFAIFEITIVFAVVSGGTLGAFIANSQPWPVVFWWTLGPVGAAALLVLMFVKDTTYDRSPGAINPTLPTPWLKNRIVTFFPGTKTQQSGKIAEVVRCQPRNKIVVSGLTSLIDTTRPSICANSRISNIYLSRKFRLSWSRSPNHVGLHIGHLSATA